MANTEDVDKFYSENYNRLIRYLMNKKKGGDKVNVISDEALDILHDCYCYHKANPDTFDEKYIWNLLKQRRIDYLRGKENYNSLKEEFFKNFYAVGPQSLEGLDVKLSRSQMLGVIKQEINEVRNAKHKEILTRHLIKGEGLDVAYERVIVQRFKEKLVDKYGDDSG